MMSLYRCTRYTRRIVDVEKANGDIVKALLYIGTTDNPNFWCSSVFSISSNTIHFDCFRRWGDDGLRYDIDRAAQIIATAVGPSGPNSEYLRNLSEFLSSLDFADRHVQDLDIKVAGILRNDLAGPE